MNNSVPVYLMVVKFINVLIKIFEIIDVFNLENKLIGVFKETHQHFRVFFFHWVG